MNHLIGNYAFGGKSITEKDFSLLLSDETSNKAESSNVENAGKVSNSNYSY